METNYIKKKWPDKIMKNIVYPFILTKECISNQQVLTFLKEVININNLTTIINEYLIENIEGYILLKNDNQIIITYNNKPFYFLCHDTYCHFNTVLTTYYQFSIINYSNIINDMCNQDIYNNDIKTIYNVANIFKLVIKTLRYFI